VTETIESTEAAAEAPKKRGGLNSMLVADLKAMAGSMGIPGARSMKKPELVEAIKRAQSGGGKSDSKPDTKPAGKSGGKSDSKSDGNDSGGQASVQTALDTGHQPVTKTVEESSGQGGQRRNRDQQRDQQSGNAEGGEERTDAQQDGNREGGRNRNRNRDNQGSGNQGGQQGGGQQGRDNQGGGQQGNRNPGGGNQGGRDQGGRDQGGRDQGGRDDSEGGRRNRRRRGRDRDNRQGGGGGGGGGRNRNEPDTTILEDDVLVPAAGILDVKDNYAFVRTSGYLPADKDAYVSLSMVRKLGLRSGDAIVGQVRQPREGERKEKFDPMVRIDSVNGSDPEAAKDRVEFAKLTPLYPSERLRLETESGNLIGRVIDIAAPIGKGQRGLIVSPPKAGKTMVMQSIANSVTTNNPECHLMVVLVDERPEEVTDFERTVKGEVISSTFDRPASDHTTVAELAIERAKRLVELGHDVVVLLDGITRLGRAYNLAAPASGRILSGGVDSAALYPPKRFFGAARNIENGGSLTILATALIETGSKMDEVIFEEFKGTGNMELRLKREFADKRIYPAIDAVQSSTRKEELLMSKEELSIIWKLRRVLSALDGQQALELLLERLKKSQSNVEFLTQVQKTTPAVGGRDD
jgi:transcription termination factor Rho